MLDIGDPAFKLFGKTIPTVSSSEFSGDSNNAVVSSEHSEEKVAEHDAEKGQPDNISTDVSILRDSPSATSATKNELKSATQTASKKGTSTSSSEDQNSPNSVDENSATESQKGTEKTQDKESLKKPDKILPCPRCNSMDTKFCYYNNYNVNQPRHFCKSCQRYWTAGGSMRNVPVGAGRRKNKTATSSKYCHLSISEALQAAQINGIHHPHKQPDSNGTVLNFGADSPLCDSMSSMTSLGEKKVLNGTRSGLYVNCRNGEIGDDHLSGLSTVTSGSLKEEGGLKVGANPIHPIPHNMQNFTGHHVFPGLQLAYEYPTVPLAPLPPPGFFPFYPAPYWNGATIPWVSPISLSPKSPGSNPNSPTLGKHSREEDTLKKSNLGSSEVLVPKTLRIDDPEEAAKSSIWTTLGIKKVEPSGNGGFFKGLQSKINDKKHKVESFPELNANPAALARSITFQETA